MWYPGCLQLVAKMYAYPFNSVISCSWMLGNPAQQRCALTGWVWVISWVVIFTSITFIFWYLKVFKLWTCRNPEQQIVLTFLGVCLLLVQWPSGCDLWPVRSGRVLDSGLFGWVRFLCPRLKCRRLSAAVRREVMKCLKPRRQRWSLSQLDFSCGRTTLGPFVLLLLSWQRRVIDEVFSLQTVQRRVTLNRVQHRGVW